MPMVTLILIIIGLGLLISYRQIGDFVFDTHAAQFRKVSGQFINWDVPVYRRVYRTLVIVAAVLCFIGALGAWFGPLDFTCGGRLCPRPPGYPL